MEFRRSVCVGSRTKVHLIDEGYSWVPKTRDFIENPSEEFGKSNVSGFRKLPTYICMLQEVRDSSYLGLLSFFGSGKEGFSFKGLFGEEK